MRFTYGQVLTSLLIAFPFAMGGQAQALSITNYQLVSSVQSTATLWQMTYKADLVNGATPWGSVTATVATTDPFTLRVVPSQNTLHFPAVAAHGQVTSTNTFAVLANPNVPLDTTKLTWTFSTTPQGPVANPGPNQSVAVGAHVIVDGSGSTNPSGSGSLTYFWAFVSRPPGTTSRLTSTYGVQSGFTVDVVGTYVLSLTVSNGIASNTADVTISTSSVPPVANPGPDQFVNIGSTVRLDGSGSTDLNGNLLSYHWTMTGLPSGSSASLSDPNAVNPAFTADLPGTYKIQLVVNDGFSNSTPATVTVTTNPPTVPMAFAGQNRTVQHNTTITLNGAGADPQGQPLVYAWTLLSQPAGSTSVLSNPAIPQPTLFVDRPGQFVAQLIVSDGPETSAPSTVTITTTNTPPVANAGMNQTVLFGRTAFLDGSGSSDADHDPLTYSWSFTHVPAGSTATISGPNTQFATFVPDLAGMYVAQLIVNDPYSSAVIPATVTITVPTPVTISLGPSPLTLSSSPVTVTVTLSVPTGASGVLISLSSSNTGIATVPPSVSVPANTASTTFLVTPGTAAGSSTITASAPGMAPGSTTVNFNPVVITLAPSPLALSSSPGTLTVNLSSPAGSNGVLIALASNNTAAATVPATVNVAANASTATFTVTPGSTAGAATITASATGMTPGTAIVNFTPVVITLTPNPLALGASPLNMTVTLSAPAGQNGVLVNLNSSSTTAATVPSSVNVPAGNSTATFAVTPGTVSGASMITAASTSMTPGTATVNYTRPPFVVVPANPVNVTVSGQATFPVSLSLPAPANGAVITLSSSDTTKVKLSAATITIAAGATTPATQPTITGVKLGTVTITASAPGYVANTQTANATETVSFYPTSVSLPFTSSVRYTWVTLSQPAPTGGVTLNLKSDNPAVATVPATITVPAGYTQAQLYVTGVSNGKTTIHASLLPFIPDATLGVSIGQ